MGGLNSISSLRCLEFFTFAKPLTNTVTSTTVIILDEIANPLTERPFKSYITQSGVGGCKISRKKTLQRCMVQCYEC